MKARLVVIGIDDILKIFQDYIGMTESLPTDAKCDTLLFNKQQMKMCLRVSAESFNGPQPPEAVNFQLRRMWGGTN